MQYFATHLRPSQQTTPSLRAAQYQHSAKRKRDEDSEERLISPDHDAHGLSATPHAQSFASLHPREVAQLRVAGLLSGDAFELPPRPFPHAPARAPHDRLTYRKVQKEVAGQDFHLYATEATSVKQPFEGRDKTPSLRQTHLNVLSTLMHRCLNEGDYERAGRAWGMILRSHIAGQPVDPRNHGRWGLSAELLLRQNSQIVTPPDYSEQRTVPDYGNAQHPAGEIELFSEEGFEAAREYYDRLIVQYPNRKLHPHAVDDRTFYPVMFSLWIREVQEKSRRSRRQHEVEARQSRSASMSIGADTSISSEDARTLEDAIQAEEIDRAREIAGKVDQLITSPPYDRQVNLLQLRGHISLWLSDLVIGREMPRDDEQDWDLESHEHHNSRISIAENLRRHTKALQELKRAEEWFERAAENGGEHQPVTLASIYVRIKDINKQIARLEKQP